MSNPPPLSEFSSSLPLPLPQENPSSGSGTVAPPILSSPFSSSILTLLPPPLRRRFTAAASVTSSSRSKFSLLFALLLFLVLILSFHVRDVVQKANKQNRLLEYSSQVSEASNLLRSVSRDATNLVILYRGAKGQSPKRQKQIAHQPEDNWRNPS